MPASKAPDLLCLAPLPGSLMRALGQRFDCHTSIADGEESLIRGLVGPGLALYREGLLQALPNLEIIALHGTGHAGLPIEYCRERGIQVTHTPDLLTEDVADVALALVLMTSRRLVEANRFLHQGSWPEAAFPPAFKPGGRRAGIFGLGRIGMAVARRLEACGLKVGYGGPRPNVGVAYPYFKSLHDLAFWSDFLILTCTGGAATRHVVNASVLEQLGPEGTLINVARGSVVDEPALVHALRHGGIRAAGLDVYEREPMVPEELVHLPNVVLLPHVGASTRETRDGMIRLVVENLTAHFQGEPLLTPLPGLRFSKPRSGQSVAIFSSPPATTAPN